MNCIDCSKCGEKKISASGSVRDSIKKVVTVIVVTVLAGGVLGLVYAQTKKPIESAKHQELERALGYVLLKFDNKPLETGRCVRLKDRDYTPTLFTATNKEGKVVGYAVQMCTTAGFGPLIELLVGASPYGEVTGVYILSHKETPGLGAKITASQEDFPKWRSECSNQKTCKGNSPFLKQFTNQKLDNFDFRVKKDGGDVCAITASTISSRAVSEAIKDALEIIHNSTSESKFEDKAS